MEIRRIVPDTSKKDYYLYEVAVHPDNQDIFVIASNDHPYHEVMNNSGMSLSVDGCKSRTPQSNNLPMLKGKLIQYNYHQSYQLILGTGGKGVFVGKLEE